MFKIIIQIVILIYTILTIYNIINIQKYNVNGFVIYTDQYNTLVENLIKLNPIQFYEKSTHITIDQLIDYNPECKITDEIKINDYNQVNDLYIYKNKELFENLDIQRFVHFDLTQLPLSIINIDLNKSFSILKGNQKTNLQLASHNYNLIGTIYGNATIYLFNPKHREGIIGKENYEIKKWGHKKYIQKNEILLIPPYWYYIQENENPIIQYHIEVDNIFTMVPNFFRNI